MNTEKKNKKKVETPPKTHKDENQNENGALPLVQM